jgi:hypothetical protein
MAATLAYIAVAVVDLVLQGVHIAPLAPLVVATPVASLATSLVRRRCKPAHRRRRWMIGGAAGTPL